MADDKDPSEKTYLSHKARKRQILWCIDLLGFYFRRKVLRQKIPLLASFKLTYRCNLKCRDCGFTPVAEASGALDMLPGSLLAGWRIFIKNGNNRF